MSNIQLSGITQNGQEKMFSLDEFQGERILLYFYPKDNTSGCTQEACDFRDNMNRLTQYVKVVGVSPDNVKSHQKFQESQHLNFPLLSDVEHTLSEKYNVWKEKSMYGRKYMGVERSTFILDKAGNIEKEWRKVNVKGHVDEVMAYLKNNPQK